MIKKITSVSNPWFKSVKKLQMKKVRNSEHRFILEGVKPTMEAIDIGKVDELILMEEQIENYSDIVFKFQGPIYSLPETLFKDIAETQTPQGILSIVKKGDFCFEHLINDDSRFFLLLDHVSDPGNMGTIIRSADAFGIDAVFLTKGCVDPYCGKAIRSTMGSILRVPIFEITTEEEQQLCNQQEVKIYSAMLEGQSVNKLEPTKGNIVLILGNEANGVDKKWKDCSSPITIPMKGKAESLNVAVAGSILIQRMTEKHF